MPRAAGIKGVAQAITQQVDTQDNEDNKQAWENPHPPGTTNEERLRLLHHVAPRGSWLLHTETQEGHIRLRQNRACQPQRCGHNDRTQSIGNQVTEENA